MIATRIFVFIFVLLIFSNINTISQELAPITKNRIVKISSEFSPIRDIIESDSKILTDVNGNFIGSVKGEIVDSVKTLKLMLQTGKSLNVIPYQSIAVSPNYANIIAYGDYTEFDIYYKLKISSYDGDGNLLSSFNSNLIWPYGLGILENGDFVIAGSDELKNRTIVRRYLNTGSLVWETEIASASDLKINVSPKSNYITIISTDDDSRERTLHVFSGTGTKLYEERYSEGIHNLEFISDNELVIFNSVKWIIYSLNSGIIKKGFGKIEGPPAGLYPISSIDKKGNFAFLTFSPSKDGYYLRIINSNSGEISHSIKISQKPTWANYRRVRNIDSKLLKVYTNEEILNYAIQ